ncbi:hypothetical protein [Cupriavidus sp. 2SB]|uniref:hypothetical protein n=1 Tax=Cupriavidus sp. 2SB TaxID=2502199 RepID=UPI0010F58ED9|nr:hypothetical protein [Cupriavidus sp. 2SB]
MLVRALKQGYAGKGGHQLREPGDEFEIEDDVAKVSLERGDTWFEPVKEEKPGARKPKADDLA